MTEITADLLVDHARGLSLRQIARKHGVGHETVRRTILQEGSELIGDLERDLLVAELTDHGTRAGSRSGLRA